MERVMGGNRTIAIRFRDLATQPRWVMLLLVLLAAASAPHLLSPYSTYLLFTVFLYATLGQSWNLAAGVTGLVSLGHAAFLGLGAYAAALLMLIPGMPVLAAVLAGGVVAAAFAAAISIPISRFRGIYFTIGTLVVAEALRLWMISWPVTGAANGIHLPADLLPGPTVLYYVALILAIGSTAGLALIMRSKLGLALNAIRDNEGAAQTLGVNVFRAKLTSLLVSSFIAGVTGAVWAAKLAYIEPFSIFNMSWTIAMVNMVIVGGMGTLAGPIIGAVFVVMLSYFLADYYTLQALLTGMILIVVIRFAPLGIWGSLRKLPSVRDGLERLSGAKGIER
jgi:branched-chain amino acid transport system permease protein